MTRKRKVLIAIFLPIIIIMILKLFYPLSYSILTGYMVAVSLIFKSTLLSIWLASKLKIIAFVKNLTLTQAFILTLKRWFIDNILTRWIKKNILHHLKGGLEEIKTYFQVLSFKAKIKNALLFIFPLGLVTWLMYLGDILSSVALTAELKVLISSFFKAIWLFLAKVGFFLSEFSQSWLAPVLEVFALGFLLESLEKLLGKGNPISRFFIFTSNLLNTFLEKAGLLHDRHIEPFIEKTVIAHSRKLSDKIIDFIQNKKISQEYLYFDNFKNILLKGHINAYYTFPDMHKITDKKELYRRINEATKDNINIMGFISRDKKGNLVDENIPNNFYHDLFILEGIASSQHHGVKKEMEDQIDYSDFWVLNTSKYPVTVLSENNNFPPVFIKGNTMQLIKSSIPADYTKNDIYALFDTKKAAITPV